MREKSEFDSSEFNYVACVLFAALGYQWALCLLHGFGMPVTPARVGIVEFIIYLSCLPLLLRKIPNGTVVVVLLLIGWIMALAIFRDGYIDFKAIRDVTIPLLFIWLGSNWRGSQHDLDKLLKWFALVVIGIGIVEMSFFDTYTRFINTFDYYVNLGGINAANAQIEGQSVTLNGLRPEGIGRTVLPQLLSNHRASSVFLEPVSFGNFAVIVYGWGIAKPAAQWRSALFFTLCALVMIALSDSRFALYCMLILALCRFAVRGPAHQFMQLLPMVCISALIAANAYVSLGRDDLLGRLASSGWQLRQFGVSALFGIKFFAADFSDAGYAYVISRMGLLLAAALWLALFMVPLPDEQARRYRTLMCVYIALILCVSGTSVFALKTAAILWFLFGALSRQPAPERTANAAPEMPNPVPPQRYRIQEVSGSH